VLTEGFNRWLEEDPAALFREHVWMSNTAALDERRAA
jgi:hypothetical protein